MTTSPSGADGYWPYDPSRTAAIIGAILYAITSIITVFQYFKFRAWVWLVVVVAVILELIGFIARTVSAKNVDDRGPYIVQFILIIVAPVLMAAGFYVVFGRIILRVLSKEHATARIIWVPPRFLTPIFVASDIVAFFVQCIGAGIVASTEPTDPDFQSKQNKGKDIVLVGLVIQIVFFGFFTVIAARFHFVGRRFAMPAEQLIMFAQSGDRKRKLKPNWQHLLTAVNIACMCIMARSIYRVVAFAQGVNGYASTEEWTFWIFDFLPVFICVVLFNILHPGKYLAHLGFRQPKAVENPPALPTYDG